MYIFFVFTSVMSIIINNIKEQVINNTIIITNIIIYCISTLFVINAMILDSSQINAALI